MRSVQGNCIDDGHVHGHGHGHATVQEVDNSSRSAEARTVTSDDVASGESDWSDDSSESGRRSEPGLGEPVELDVDQHGRVVAQFAEKHYRFRSFTGELPSV